MSYIEIATNKYPISERDIRNKFPNATFPKPFNKDGYEVVFATPKPTYTELERAIESVPVLTDKNTWEQSWAVLDKYSDYSDEDGVTHTKEEQEVAFLLTKKATKIKELANIRYEHEVGGTSVNGVSINTARDAQAMIHSAYTAVQINPDRIINWKSDSGEWITIDATTVTTIAKAVIDHVQACFDNEMKLSLDLKSDIDTDLTIGWPTITSEE